MANKISLRFNQNKFPDLIDKLQDLTSINDTIKMKIDSKNILLYSILSNESAVLALKSYLINTDEYLDKYDEDETFDLVIGSSGKFVKQLKFIDPTKDIKASFTYKTNDEDENHVRAINFVNGKLKLNLVGSELSEIKNINKDFLESRLDSDNSKWKFDMSTNDVLNVKRLSSIYSDDRIITMTAQNSLVTFSESSKWELEVGIVDGDVNQTLNFNKKYLSNINMEEEFVNFSIFETFILVKDHNSNLMLSFEVSWDDED